MAEVTLRELEDEKIRLHGVDFNGLVAVVDSAKLRLKVKDSRSTIPGGNPADRNQAWEKHGISPGTWKTYSLQESRQTFVA